MGRSGFARPVHQHTHALGRGRLGIGVEQQHGVRLQTLGAVDGEQPHGLRLRSLRRPDAPGLERAHETVGGEKTPAVLRQCLPEQAVQLDQHSLALARRNGHRKARQHVAFSVDGGQRVVRRQAVGPALVERQAPGSLGEFFGERHEALLMHRQRGPALQHLAPGGHLGFLARLAGRHGPTPLQRHQLHQRRIGPAEQRRFERPRQTQVVRGRDQRVEQRDHILHRRGLAQVQLFRLLAGYAALAQRLKQPAQALAFARQHHEVFGLEPA